VGSLSQSIKILNTKAMEIKVTLDASPAFMQVLTTLATVLQPQAAATAAPVKKAKDTPAKEQPTAELKEATTETGETTMVVETKVTIEQVRAAVQKAAAGDKRDKVKVLLSEFGADKVTALKAEQYADFLTKVEAL
jgi:hypothetical protein